MNVLANRAGARPPHLMQWQHPCAFARDLRNRECPPLFGGRFKESLALNMMPQVSASGVAGGGLEDKADLLTATSLPDWIVRALADNGVSRVSEVSAMTDMELLGLRGVGQRSVKLIRATIVSHRRRKKLGLLEP